MALAACVLRVSTKKRSSTFWRKKVHPGDLAGGFSDLEMTWLLYCTGAATGKYLDADERKRKSIEEQLCSGGTTESSC